MIITFASQKGGTACSAMCTNIAVLRATREPKSKLLIIDTDPQGSSYDWNTERLELGINPEIECIKLKGKHLVEEIDELEKIFKDIVIDVGGKDSEELRLALLTADKLIVPTLPSQFDIWALEFINKIIPECRKAGNKNLIGNVLFTRVSTHPSIGIAEVKEAETAIEDYKYLSLMKSVIRERNVWRKSSRSGIAVEEITPPDQKAKLELNALYNEIYRET
jgi:chromosome partitioning protein